MAKTLSIVVGAVVAIIGMILLLTWRADFVTVVKGTLPILFIFGGVIALIAGASELTDSLKERKK